MLDLFGLEQQTPRTNSRPEAAALVEVLKALRTHPAVAWAERMNTGAAKVGTRFIRFGWPGCPDVLGQLKDGRFLGVEVKAQAERLREARAAQQQAIDRHARPQPKPPAPALRVVDGDGWVRERDADAQDVSAWD